MATTTYRDAMRAALRELTDHVFYEAALPPPSTDRGLPGAP